MVSIIKALIAWVMYMILVNSFDVSIKYAAGAAIFITVIISYKYLAKGFILNWAVLVSLAVTFIISFTQESTLIGHDPWILVDLLMAILSWGSLIIKKPFTIQYSKESVPIKKWCHPAFIQLNKVISLVWAIIFVLLFFLHLYKTWVPDNHNVSVFLIYLLTIGGVIFSIKYPAYQRAKIRNHIPGEMK